MKKESAKLKDAQNQNQFQCLINSQTQMIQKGKCILDLCFEQEYFLQDFVFQKEFIQQHKKCQTVNDNFINEIVNIRQLYDINQYFKKDKDYAFNLQSLDIIGQYLKINNLEELICEYIQKYLCDKNLNNKNIFQLLEKSLQLQLAKISKLLLQYYWVMNYQLPSDDINLLRNYFIKYKEIINEVISDDTENDFQWLKQIVSKLNINKEQIQQQWLLILKKTMQFQKLMPTQNIQKSKSVNDLRTKQYSINNQNQQSANQNYKEQIKEEIKLMQIKTQRLQLENKLKQKNINSLLQQSHYCLNQQLDNHSQYFSLGYQIYTYWLNAKNYQKFIDFYFQKAFQKWSKKIRNYFQIEFEIIITGSYKNSLNDNLSNLNIYVKPLINEHQSESLKKYQQKLMNFLESQKRNESISNQTIIQKDTIYILSFRQLIDNQIVQIEITFKYAQLNLYLLKEIEIKDLIQNNAYLSMFFMYFWFIIRSLQKQFQFGSSLKNICLIYMIVAFFQQYKIDQDFIDFFKIGKAVLQFVRFYAFEFEYTQKYIQINQTTQQGIWQKTLKFDTNDFVIIDSKNSNINYTKSFTHKEDLILIFKKFYFNLQKQIPCFHNQENYYNQTINNQTQEQISFKRITQEELKIVKSDFNRKFISQTNYNINETIQSQDYSNWNKFLNKFGLIQSKKEFFN